MSGFREENIRVRITAISELGSVSEQLQELIRLTKQQQELTQQSALAARTNALQQVSAIEGVTAALKEQQSQQKKTTDEGADSLKKVSSGYDELGKTVRSFATLVGAAFTLNEVKGFVTDIVDAKTKIDSFKTSLDTMLGSKKESAELYQQIVALAKTTPFGLEDLTGEIVKLKAYNISTGDLIPTITALGNIAAAVGKEKLPQLTLAYGQVANANVLMGTELRQFTEAGVPLLSLIAKAYDKTKESVIQMAADHQISFAMVRKALLDASAEGGKYANLMQSLSQTVGGEVSNMADSFFVAKARIGDFFENQIRSGTRALNELIDAVAGSNTAIGRSLDIVKSVGSAFLTYTVATRAQSVADTALLALTTAKNVLYGEYLLAIRAVTAQQVVFTAAETEAVVAARGFNLALSSNPIGLVVTALGTLATAYYAYQAINTEVTTQLGEQELALRTEQSQLNALTNAAMGAALGTKERKEAIDGLISKYPEYFSGINAEKVTNSDLKKILDSVNASYQTRASLARQAYNLEGLAAKQKELFEAEKDFFDKLPKEINVQFGGDITRFVAALEKGGQVAANLKKQLDDFAPGGAEFFGAVAKNAAEKFKAVEKSYTDANANMQASDQVRIKAAEAAENERWKVQVATLKKGTDDYKAAEQTHLDNLAKINGTYREKEVASQIQQTEKLKSITLLSDAELKAINQASEADQEVDRIKQLKAQIDFLNTQEKAEQDSVRRIQVARNISNAELASLKEAARQKEAEIDRKYDLQRATIMEQIEAEEQKAFLAKVQESNDKVAVMTAKRLEAEKMLVKLNDAETNQERLAALEEYNQKYAVEVKESVVEQLRVQLDASAQLLEEEAEKNGERGEAYRKAYQQWLKDNEAYNAALTAQTATSARETAQTIEHYENVIRESRQKTAELEKETLKKSQDNRRELLNGLASLVSQDTGLFGQIGSGLISVYNSLDGLNLKAVDSAKTQLKTANDALLGIQMIYSDGSAQGEAMVAKATKDVADAKKGVEEAKGISIQAGISLAMTIFQVLSSITNAINQATAEAYQAIADSIQKTKEAYKELSDSVVQSSADAHKREMEAFNGTLQEKLAAIDAYYAREKEYAIGQDRLNDQLTYYQQQAQLRADSLQNAQKVIEDLEQFDKDKKAQEKQRIQDQHDFAIAKAEEIYNAKLDYINKELDAFKDAKDKEIDGIEDRRDAAITARQQELDDFKDKLNQQIDALNENLARQKEAIGQFYDDKTLRLQNDDVFRKQLLADGEVREIAALEAAKGRELARTTSVEERARIEDAFNVLIRDKHNEYQQAMGDKAQEVSLATREVKARETEDIQKKETDTKDVIVGLKDQIAQKELETKQAVLDLQVQAATNIQTIMGQIADQEAKASDDRLKANADYVRQVMMANSAQFEANKRMKVAELTAEIAVLEGQKGLFANNPAISAAQDAIQQAIGQITALSYDTGGVSIQPIRSQFGTVSFLRNPVTLPGGITPANGGGPGSPVGGGGDTPGYPVDGAGKPLTVAYDDKGNEIALTYAADGHSFDAYDRRGNAIRVRYATGFAAATGRQYFVGTEFVSGLGYPAGRDTVPAWLTEGERVMTVDQNRQLGDISNDDLVLKMSYFDKLAAAYPQLLGPSMWSELAQTRMSLPAGVMSPSVGNSIDLSELTGAVRSMEQSFKQKELLSIQIDKSGFSTALISQQAKVNYYGNLLNR